MLFTDRVLEEGTTKINRCSAPFLTRERPGCARVLQVSIIATVIGMVLVEPSIHSDKGPYRWMPSFNPALIKEITKDELEKRLQHLATAVLIVRNFPTDGGHDYANSLCGFLLRNGMAFEDLEHILEACWPKNKVRHHNIAGALRDTDAKLKRDAPVKGSRSLEAMAPGLPKALARALGWDRPDGRDGRCSYRCTDIVNAERFADRHGRDLRYCFPWGVWLIFDGKRWKVDDTGHVVHLAKETARSIFEEAAKADNDERTKELGKWAIQSQSEKRIKSMIELATSEPGIGIRHQEELRGRPKKVLCQSQSLVPTRSTLTKASSAWPSLIYSA